MDRPENALSSARRLVVSQGILSVGATFAAFGIDVWFYQSSASYAGFALIYIATVLPPILVAPFAGFMTDRISKPRILYLSQLCTVGALAALAVLYLADSLNLPTITTGVFLLATAGEFRYIATTALIPHLVEESDLAAVNGIQQAFRGGAVILGPLLGAVGYQQFGLFTLLAVAALLAIDATCVARAFARNACDVKKSLRLRRLVGDYAAGLAWLNGQRQLKIILIQFTLVFGAFSTFRALIVPHVLDADGEGLLATVASMQGAGMLCTGLALARIRRRADSESAAFFGCHALGVAILLFGMSRHAFLLAGASFLVGASICVISTANQGIWQSRTPSHFQGRMVAIRSVTLYLLSPLAVYASVPMSRYVKSDVGFGEATWSTALMMGLGTLILGVSIISHLCYLTGATNTPMLAADDDRE